MSFLPGGFHIYLHVTQPTRTGFVRESVISSMVRRGTVYIAASLSGRTRQTESEFCMLCFCHRVAPRWLCKAVWDPSRMVEPPLPGLLAFAVWMSLVYSRWGGISFPLLEKKRQQRLRHRLSRCDPWEHVKASRPRGYSVSIWLRKHISPSGVL